MSADELLTLRDNVSRAVSEKISELRTQLQRLAFEARSSSGAKAQRGRRGGKVPPKYRDPENPSNVWAGRGAEPRWLREKIRAGAKREEFLIGTSETSPRKKRSKKSARRATKTTVRARAKAKAKVKSKRSKQTRAKPKLRRATGRKRESAAKLPQSAPTSAATTESGA
jgi:DNA-binding protein H-NS